MRVGIISASFPPDFGWDGSSTRVYELALGLAAAGHEVEVFALSAEGQSETLQDGMKVHRVLVNQKLVQMNLVPKTTPNSLTIWSSRTELWKACLRAHAHRPFDVVDIPNTLWDGLVPALSSLFPLVVRLQESHSVYDRTSLGKPSAFDFDRQLISQLSEISIQLAEKVYSPTAQLAAEICGDQSNVEIIADPINFDWFTVYGAAAQPKDSDKKLIICGKVKDAAVHRYVSNVIKKVAERDLEIRFLILAEDITSDDEEHHAQESFKSVLAEPKPVSVTRAYHQLLPELLRSGSIVLVAPNSDRIPYAWLEPMAIQRAVVANSHPLGEHYIRANEDALLVKPFDEDATVEAVMTLHNDRAIRQRTAVAGSRAVHENHRRDNCTKKLEAVYKSAKKSFTSKDRAARRALVMHDVVSKSELLVAAYDKMLYDLLFSESREFRLKHWFNKLTGAGSESPLATRVKNMLGIKHSNGKG